MNNWNLSKIAIHPLYTTWSCLTLIILVSISSIDRYQTTHQHERIPIFNASTFCRLSWYWIQSKYLIAVAKSNWFLFHYTTSREFGQLNQTSILVIWIMCRYRFLWPTLKYLRDCFDMISLLKHTYLMNAPISTNGFGYWWEMKLCDLCMMMPHTTHRDFKDLIRILFTTLNLYLSFDATWRHFHDCIKLQICRQTKFNTKSAIMRSNLCFDCSLSLILPISHPMRPNGRL